MRRKSLRLDSHLILMWYDFFFSFYLRKGICGMNEIANAFCNQEKNDQSKECVNHLGEITKSGPSLSHSLPYIPKFMSKLDKSCTLKSF